MDRDLLGNAIVIGLVLVGVLAWLTVSLRWALRLRVVPAPDHEAYVAHYRAVGSTLIFVATVTTFAPALCQRWQPALMGLVAASTVGVVLLGERHWPGPRGTIRTAVVGPPRRFADLVPWASVAVACVGLVFAAVTAVQALGGNDSGLGLLAIAGLLLLLAVSTLTLRTIDHRPALPAVPPAADLKFRRGAANRVVRLVAIGGLVTGLTLQSSASWLTWIMWGLVMAMVFFGSRLRQPEPGAAASRRRTHAPSS